MFKSIVVIILSFYSLLLNAQNVENTNKGIDRWSFGGDFNLAFGSIAVINISPLAAYKVNNRLSLGGGLIYNYVRYSEKAFGSRFESTIFGGRILGRYRFMDRLFVHSEFQNLNMDTYSLTGNYLGRANVQMLFVGGGYLYPIGDRMYMSGMLLYDLIEDWRSPYQNPLIQIGLIYNP